MVNDVLVSVFGGKMFPLEIAPSFLQKLSSFLPYKYIYYVPTLVLEEKLGVRSILIQALYVVILYVAARIVYKCGLKKYEASGM